MTYNVNYPVKIMLLSSLQYMTRVTYARLKFTLLKVVYKIMLFPPTYTVVPAFIKYRVRGRLIKLKLFFLCLHSGSNFNRNLLFCTFELLFHSVYAKLVLVLIRNCYQAGFCFSVSHSSFRQDSSAYCRLSDKKLIS